MTHPTFKAFLLLFTITSLLLGCEDQARSSLPEYPVYLDLNLTSTYPTFKNSVNQTLVFKTREGLPEVSRIGYGGLLICTDYVGDYYAFDLCCPYELKSSTRVRPDGTGQAICDSCKSVFNILTAPGNPVSGKAKEFLRRYHAIINGDVLRITR